MIPQALYTELTRRFPAFQELDPSRRAVLRERAHPLQARRGQMLFDEGAVCSDYVFLLEGCLKVVKPAPSGREILLYKVVPGETCVLSVSCLMEEIAYPARGIAETDSHGALVPRGLFIELVHELPGLREMLLRSLSTRIFSLMGLVEEIAFHRLDHRLARTLLRRAEESDSLDLSVTHQELADELGSVREIVSRLLGSFAEEGLVRLERGAIHLLQPDRLREISLAA